MNEQDIKQAWQCYPSDKTIHIKKEELMESITAQSAQFNRRIKHRDLRETIVSLFLVGFFGTAIFLTPYPVSKIGAAIIMLSSLWIIYKLHSTGKTAGNEGVEESLQEQMKRQLKRVEAQISLLNRVWLWYLLPLSVGVLMFYLPFPVSFISKVMFSVLVIILFGGIFGLNKYVVKKYLQPLQRRLELNLTQSEQSTEQE